MATYLLSSSTDFEVWLVNPRETEILGHPVYPSLADLPAARADSLLIAPLADALREHYTIFSIDAILATPP